jgi:predicted phosphohydrolase
MRLLVTADLHYNHARSREMAADIIGRMNQVGGDGVLVVGDTATADGEEIEACLSLFTIPGPRLFLCGNHELWTRGPNSYTLFTDELPRRVRALGWQWLETDPFVARGFAVVGTIGWYDYSFASPRLAIPRRFYEAKISPGAAEYFNRADLLAAADDLSPEAAASVARWNDGKFVKLGRSDEAFVDECVARLETNLARVAGSPEVLVATHHIPFRELLPPPRFSAVEFAKAYLGSERLGRAILPHRNVRRVFCGHSHFASRATVGHLDAVNIGSSYRWKTFEAVDLPD